MKTLISIVITMSAMSIGALAQEKGASEKQPVAGVRELTGACFVRNGEGSKLEKLKLNEGIRAGQQISCIGDARLVIVFESTDAKKEVTQRMPDWFTVPNVAPVPPPAPAGASRPGGGQASIKDIEREIARRQGAPGALLKQAQQDSIKELEGYWDITIETPQGDRRALLVLEEKAGELIGAIRTAGGEVRFESVTVDNNEITFVLDLPSSIDASHWLPGQKRRSIYKGMIERGFMAGVATFDGLSTGRWSAVPHREVSEKAAEIEGAIAASGAPRRGTDPLSGTWTGDWGPSAADRNKVTVELKWDGNALKGTVNPGPNAVALQKCTFDPKTGAIHMEADAKNRRGNDIHYVIDGKVDGNTMTGSWSHDNRNGDFKITRE